MVLEVGDAADPHICGPRQHGQYPQEAGSSAQVARAPLPQRAGGHAGGGLGRGPAGRGGRGGEGTGACLRPRGPAA